MQHQWQKKNDILFSGTFRIENGTVFLYLRQSQLRTVCRNFAVASSVSSSALLTHLRARESPLKYALISWEMGSLGMWFSNLNAHFWHFGCSSFGPPSSCASWFMPWNVCVLSCLQFLEPQNFAQLQCRIMSYVVSTAFYILSSVFTTCQACGVRCQPCTQLSFLPVLPWYRIVASSNSTEYRLNKKVSCVVCVGSHIASHVLWHVVLVFVQHAYLWPVFLNIIKPFILL